MDIHPDIEAFFILLALTRGPSPRPTYGADRHKLVREFTMHIAQHADLPEAFNAVRKNYAELGGKLLAIDPSWYHERLAESYLDWLYSHPTGTSYKISAPIVDT